MLKHCKLLLLIMFKYFCGDFTAEIEREIAEIASTKLSVRAFMASEIRVPKCEIPSEAKYQYKES